VDRVPPDWDRSLRSGNYPETTRYNYFLAAAQLARYLGEYSPDPDADDAAADPAAVTRGHVEAFQAWMIETRSASTALNKHKGLQQFFKWLLVGEQEPSSATRWTESAHRRRPRSWCP
jgi:integrase/recombinase XerC